MFNLRGVITAMITPFDSQGRLDEEGLRRNIDFQIENGVDALLFLGTTGESPTLKESEKKRIVEIARKQCVKTHLMVGCGSNSTEQTVKNALWAQKLGADSLLVVVPYYNKPTQEGIFRHFSAIAKEIDIPIVVYNIPGRCAVNILPETMVRLAEIPKIVAVKEASGSLRQTESVLHNIPDFTLFSGDDGLTLPIMALGGRGVISVASNICPAPVKRLVNCCLNFDFQEAKRNHFSLLPLFETLFIETNPAPIKALMNMRGMRAGPCRAPLCELTTVNLRKLKLLLNDLETEQFCGHYG